MTPTRPRQSKSRLGEPGSSFPAEEAILTQANLGAHLLSGHSGNSGQPSCGGGLLLFTTYPFRLSERPPWLPLGVRTRPLLHAKAQPTWSRQRRSFASSRPARLAPDSFFLAFRRERFAVSGTFWGTRSSLRFYVADPLDETGRGGNGSEHYEI